MKPPPALTARAPCSGRPAVRPRQGGCYNPVDRSFWDRFSMSLISPEPGWGTSCLEDEMAEYPQPAWTGVGPTQTSLHSPNLCSANWGHGYFWGPACPEPPLSPYGRCQGHENRFDKLLALGSPARTCPVCSSSMHGHHPPDGIPNCKGPCPLCVAMAQALTADDAITERDQQMAGRAEQMTGHRCIGPIHPKVALRSGFVGGMGFVTRYECPCAKWYWVDDLRMRNH